MRGEVITAPFLGVVALGNIFGNIGNERALVANFAVDILTAEEIRALVRLDIVENLDPDEIDPGTDEFDEFLGPDPDGSGRSKEW